MAKASAAASAMVENEGGSVTTTTTTTTQLTGVLLNMMKKILYGAHSNVAMGLGWRAAGGVTKYCSGQGRAMAKASAVAYR